MPAPAKKPKAKARVPKRLKSEIVYVEKAKPKQKKKANKGHGLLATAGEVGGAALASALGMPFLAPLGSAAGGALGSLVSQITGFGDYKVNENTLMDGGLTPPQVVNTMNDGGFVVRHREYLGEVYAAEAFTNTRYELNPGLETTFPWLSQVALAFEQYRFRGLLFEFNSTSSDAVLSTATSSSLGTVSMATEYDVLEPNFPDKRAMLNHEFSNSRKPSCSFIHPIECAPTQTPITKLYVRSEYEAVPANADLRLYDWGAFQIASEGQQAAGGVIGELWATYEVEFYKSKYHGAASFSKNNIEVFTINQVSSAYLTNPVRVDDLSNLTGTITSDTTYHVPHAVVGDIWFFLMQCISDSGTSGYPSVVPTNMQALARFWNPGPAQTATFTDGTGAATTSWCGASLMAVTDINCSIGFSGGSSGANGTGSFWAIRIGQNTNMLNALKDNVDNKVDQLLGLISQLTTKSEVTEEDRLSVSQILGTIPREDLVRLAKKNNK